jgi:hypothetical protein
MPELGKIHDWGPLKPIFLVNFCSDVTHTKVYKEELTTDAHR